MGNLAEAVLGISTILIKYVIAFFPSSHLYTYSNKLMSWKAKGWLWLSPQTQVQRIYNIQPNEPKQKCCRNGDLLSRITIGEARSKEWSSHNRETWDRPVQGCDQLYRRIGRLIIEGPGTRSLLAWSKDCSSHHRDMGPICISSRSA